MQLRFVIERAAQIPIDTVLNRPADEVAEAQEIKMQIERDAVIEPKVVVVDHAVVHECKTERDDSAVQAPKEKVRAFWHPAPELAEVIFGESLELLSRPRLHLLIERVDFVNHVGDVAHHL